MILCFSLVFLLVFLYEGQVDKLAINSALKRFRLYRLIVFRWIICIIFFFTLSATFILLKRFILNGGILVSMLVAEDIYNLSVKCYFIYVCLFLILMASRMYFLLFLYVISMILVKIFRISADENLSVSLLCVVAICLLMPK